MVNHSCRSWYWEPGSLIYGEVQEQCILSSYTDSRERERVIQIVERKKGFRISFKRGKAFCYLILFSGGREKSVRFQSYDFSRESSLSLSLSCHLAVIFCEKFGENTCTNISLIFYPAPINRMMGLSPSC